MKIVIKDIKTSPTEIHFVEGVQELNGILTEGSSGEYHFIAPLHVDMVHVRSGDDLLFSGKMKSELIGQCGRCLEEYPLSLDREFSLVLSPGRTLEREQELTVDELSAGFYNPSEEEIDLSALVHEETLLALPSRPLCREECRGLCSQCGINLNLESCECRPVWKDPRLAILSKLRVPSQS